VFFSSPDSAATITFVAQAAQGREPVAGQADFEGAEQVDGGIRDAQPLGAAISLMPWGWRYGARRRRRLVEARRESTSLTMPSRA